MLTLNSNQSLLSTGSDEAARQAMRAETIKYAVIVVAVVPILCLYPFLAKYLEKGMLVGSLKG